MEGRAADDQPRVTGAADSIEFTQLTAEICWLICAEWNLACPQNNYK
jgi:hypothetical protein